MMAVIFEFEVRDGKETEYFELASRMRAELEQVDGFMGVERFQSLSNPGKFVSISLWRDDGAIAAWRAHDDHQSAQRRGRNEIFTRYRLLVGGIVREMTLDAFGRHAMIEHE